MALRSSPSEAATRAASASSTGPSRSSGGAANARPASVRRIVISPASHSWVNRSAPLPVSSAQAWQVPSVGWPANGSSATGVKIRTR